MDNSKILDFFNRKNIKNKINLKELNINEEELFYLVKKDGDMIRFIDEDCIIWDCISRITLSEFNTRLSIVFFFCDCDFEFEKKYLNLEMLFEDFRTNMELSRSDFIKFLDNTLEITMPLLMKLGSKNISNDFIVQGTPINDIDTRIIRNVNVAKRCYEEVDKIFHNFKTKLEKNSNIKSENISINLKNEIINTKIELELFKLLHENINNYNEILKLSGLLEKEVYYSFKYNVIIFSRRGKLISNEFEKFKLLEILKLINCSNTKVIFEGENNSRYISLTSEYEKVKVTHEGKIDTSDYANRKYMNSILLNFLEYKDYNNDGIAVISNPNRTLEMMKTNLIEWNDSIISQCIDQGGYFVDSYKDNDRIVETPNMALTFIVREHIANKEKK